MYSTLKKGGLIYTLKKRGLMHFELQQHNTKTLFDQFFFF